MLHFMVEYAQLLWPMWTQLCIVLTSRVCKQLYACNVCS